MESTLIDPSLDRSASTSPPDAEPTPCERSYLIISDRTIDRVTRQTIRLDGVDSITAALRIMGSEIPNQVPWLADDKSEESQFTNRKKRKENKRRNIHSLSRTVGKVKKAFFRRNGRSGETPQRGARRKEKKKKKKRHGIE